MNKTCLPFSLAFALAACAAANVHAQSSVTVYGSIDASMRYQTNVDAAGNGLASIASGQYYSNRLGFRGVEDLGGGLKARFTLESGFASDTGALDNTNNVLFNRTASVGLGGAWGNLDVGRMYTLAFRTEKFLDPFDHHFTPIVPLSSGAGTTLPAAARTAGLGAGASSGTRFNNNVEYAKSMGPLTVRAAVAAGEVAGDSSRGAAQAVAFSYDNKSLLLAGAYTHKETATGFANRAWVAGGGYNFGNTTVKLGHSREEQDAGAVDYRNQITWAGASHQAMPALDVTLAFYHTRYNGPAAAEGKRDLLLLGASYALSKRTNLYAEFDLNRYDGALLPASGQERQRGTSFGINHLF